MDRYIQLHNKDFQTIRELNTKVAFIESELETEKEWRKHYEKYSTDIKQYITGYRKQMESTEKQRDHNYDEIKSDIEKIQNDIRQIQIVLNSQNTRLNQIEGDMSNIRIQNHNIDEQMKNNSGLIKEVCDEYDNIRCEIITLQSKEEVMATVPSSFLNASTFKSENFKSSSDFSKWASLLTKVTSLEKILFEEKSQRKINDDKLRKIDNNIFEIKSKLEDSQNSISKYDSKIEERINLSFDQYNVIFKNFSDKVDIRINKLESNTYDIVSSSKKMCKDLEEVLREEIRTRIESTKECNSKLIKMSEDQSITYANIYEAKEMIKNRYEELSKIIEFKYHLVNNELHKCILEQLDMINV